MFVDDNVFNSTALIMILFPIGHVAAGLGMIIYSIYGFVNSTTIKVESEILSVIHTPLPWFGTREIPVDNIIQLYCEEKLRNTRYSRTYMHGSRYYTYNVNIVLSDNKQVSLVSGIQDKSQALFIESKIESYLGIKDEQVAGEIHKDS